jgi:hypothetical protein
MTENHLDALADDINANGLRELLVEDYDGVALDGQTRGDDQGKTLRRSCDRRAILLRHRSGMVTDEGATPPAASVAVANPPGETLAARPLVSMKGERPS